MTAGILRWIGFSGNPQWHLRFGGSGAPLCGITQPSTRTRWLSDGAPSRRCAECLEVAAFRLGIKPS